MDDTINGQMNSEQQAFTAYLVDLFKPKDVEEFDQIISKLTKNEINELYKKFKTMEGNNSLFAKLGAKINYISKLNGKCPEGYEVEKFMSGGCVKCKKKLKEDATSVFKEKCGGKAKKRIKKHTDGSAFKPIKGGPGSVDSTREMILNPRQKSKLNK